MEPRIQYATTQDGVSIAIRWWLCPVIGFAAALALAALVLACGNGGVGGDEATSSTWLDLLSRIPDTSETRQWAVMHDYARARETLGIQLPDTDANAETLDQYGEQLASRGVLAGGGPLTEGLFFAPDEWRIELGFTSADVDQKAQAGGQPKFYQVLRGRFDHEAIDEAVRNDPLFSEFLEEASHSGFMYYTWGEDLAPIDAERTSKVRRLGRGHRLALHENYLYWTVWTEGVEGMIDAGLGERPSLADVEYYQLLAEGMDSLDTYTAFFTEATEIQSIASGEICGFGCTPEVEEALREELEAQPRLLPYQAFATGAGVDADGAYVAIVLVHDDEEVATQNVRRLEKRIEEGETIVESNRPWSEVFSDSEISSEGRVVLARLRGGSPTFWFEFVVRREPLLLH